MYYEDNRVKDLKVAYIGGGSRGWAWGFMMDLAAVSYTHLTLPTKLEV